MLHIDLFRTRERRNGCGDPSYPGTTACRKRQPLDGPRQERVGGIAPRQATLSHQFPGRDDPLPHQLGGFGWRGRELHSARPGHGHQQIEPIQQGP